jgi:hypothetical protein
VFASPAAVSIATAKSGKKAEAPPPGAAGPANACGCYSTGASACICTKKGKCGCPGECEPKGCEEKRQKEIERQIAAETKKAAEADKKQRKASADAERARSKPITDDSAKKTK